MSEEQVNQTPTETVETTVETPTETVTETAVPEASTTEAASLDPVVDSSAPVEYWFEGAKVEAVVEELADGTKKCKMSDGTEKHVPAEIFN